MAKIAIPKFNVGQSVKANFEDTFFENGCGVIREINIKVSSVGVHVEYWVADVNKRGVISREFRLDEDNLEAYELEEEEK